MGAIEMDFKNNLKEKLSEGKTVFGSWSMIPSPMVANVMAESGIDFIIAAADWFTRAITFHKDSQV